MAAIIGPLELEWDQDEDMLEVAAAAVPMHHQVKKGGKRGENVNVQAQERMSSRCFCSGSV